MVDELDRKHLNLMVFFESTNVDMVSLGDIEENTVDKEEEGLNVEELTPGETQVEKELREALIVDSLFVQLFLLAPTTHFFDLFAPLHALLLHRVHVTLIFLVKLFAAPVI